MRRSGVECFLFRSLPACLPLLLTASGRSPSLSVSLSLSLCFFFRSRSCVRACVHTSTHPPTFSLVRRSAVHLSHARTGARRSPSLSRSLSHPCSQSPRRFFFRSRAHSACVPHFSQPCSQPPSRSFGVRPSTSRTHARTPSLSRSLALVDRSATWIQPAAAPPAGAFCSHARWCVRLARSPVRRHLMHASTLGRHRGRVLSCSRQRAAAGAVPFSRRQLLDLTSHVTCAHSLTRARPHARTPPTVRSHTHARTHAAAANLMREVRLNPRSR